MHMFAVSHAPDSQARAWLSQGFQAETCGAGPQGQHTADCSRRAQGWQTGADCACSQGRQADEDEAQQTDQAGQTHQAQP